MLKPRNASCTAWPGYRSPDVLNAQRVDFILRRQQELYPETPVPLDHKDPYTLLVAVLLSAQCTDERVNQVTPALFRLADNPRDMALQDVQAIPVSYTHLTLPTIQL